MNLTQLRRWIATRTRERRREQAARWLVTLEHTEPSARTIDRWGKWIAVSENQQAFAEVERIWQLSGSASSLQPARAGARSGDEYDGSESIALWRARQAVGRRLQTRSAGFLCAIGLSAALVMVAIGLPVWIGDFLGLRRDTAVLATGLAEHKVVVLEDGSRIHLGAQTSVLVRFTSSQRSVVLGQGEALFSVARDPERPFRVSAGSGVITAVGTAFNVRRHQDDDVVVSVTDGIVQVTPRTVAAEPTAEGAQRLVRGQRVTYDAEGTIGTVSETELGVAAAWRDGRFRYDIVPLRHVIEDINRYSKRRIVVAEAAAGTLLYSGTVFAPNIDEWIKGLEQIYPELNVNDEEPNVTIQLRPAARQ